eukprot:6189246-Pleurochrysis_carterae.AAC.2
MAGTRVHDGSGDVLSSLQDGASCAIKGPSAGSNFALSLSLCHCLDLTVSRALTLLSVSVSVSLLLSVFPPF